MFMQQRRIEQSSVRALDVDRNFAKLLSVLAAYSVLNGSVALGGELFTKQTNKQCILDGKPRALESQVIYFKAFHSVGIRSHCGGYSFLSDVQPWLSKCARRIRQSGFTKDVFAGRVVKLQIELRDIEFESATGILKIVRSSGYKTADAAALTLVKSAAPFELPEIILPANRPMLVEMNYPNLEIKFTPTRLDRDFLWWHVDPFVPPSHSQTKTHTLPPNTPLSPT